MVVGSRLTVRATPDFEKLGITDKEQQKKIKKALEREFRDWAYDSRLLQDAEGHYDYGGMAWLMRSEEHTSELQSLMRISYAVFCLKKNISYTHRRTTPNHTQQ